jgi:hypothetical protein
MDNKETQYIQTDNNTFINKTHIKWVKQMNECMDMCVKNDGCREVYDTHRICKLANPVNYQKLSNIIGINTNP